MIRVANGQIIQFTNGTRMMHGVVQAVDLTRVMVQEVMTGFDLWSLPHPPEQGITMFGQLTQGPPA